MQKQNRAIVVCAALALVFGVNSCAWMSNTMSRAKERIVAMRERMKAKKPAEEVAAAAPAQVAAVGSAAGSGHGHHVIAGTGKPIANGVGECVNTGIDPAGAHGTGCGAAADVAATDAAPAAQAMPVAEKPVAAPKPVPVPERSVAQTPTPNAQPSEELFPPATEPVQPAQAPTATSQAAAPSQPATSSAAPAVVEQAMPKPPAPTEQISLSADALFPFAKYTESSMLPAGKAKLKEIATRIKGAGPGAINRIAITGHADRLGRTERKALVSERRAQTVKSYLAKLGVDASLMSAAGKSDSEPRVFCKGNKRTAKLKNCLAPNRRVDVAFFGDKEKIAHSR